MTTSQTQRPPLLAPRRRAREVPLGDLILGGDHPIRVQTMTATDTADAAATIAQIESLAEAGAEVMRVTVDTIKAARALPGIRARCPIPLVADIHYSHRLAIEAAPYVDKIRINPGNIGDEDKVRAVIARADEFGLPIRVGVNQGSLEEEIGLRYGAHISEDGILMPPEEGYPPQALVDSALRNIEILESHGFTRTIISVKSSSVPMMIHAYRMLAAQCDYPLHLGVTEAGTRDNSNIKSSIGIGTLLSEGIGDTIRVSIATRDTVEKADEITFGFKILQALGLRRFGIEVVSCPTCGREDVGFDTARIARELEALSDKLAHPVKVSVMGCYVNGPGEAAEADLGVVAAGTAARIYLRGKVLDAKVPFADIIPRMTELIESFHEERERD